MQSRPNRQPLSDSEGNVPQGRLSGRDVLLLLGLCGLLFGLAILRRRDPSVHEAVLLQSAITMAADGDHLVPKMGPAPWLETPPLPHWISVGLLRLGSVRDALAWVRVGPVLMATLGVVATALLAARAFGRRTGLLAGLLAATTYQVGRYAWLAEDDVFLFGWVSASLAWFARIEFPRPASSSPVPDRDPAPARFLGGRSPGVLLFFVMAGLAGLMKSFVFGPAMVLLPVGAFLVVDRLSGGDPGRLRRYAWFWGALVTIALAGLWPTLVALRVPGALELWDLDLFGRLDGRFDDAYEPPGYYALALTWVLAPWTLVLPWGFAALRRSAPERSVAPERVSFGRLLLCWALVVPLALSIPSWKHHHYLLSGLTPWIIVAALGFERVTARLRPAARPLLIGAVAGLMLTLQWNHEGSHHADGEFLRTVQAREPRDEPIFVDLDTGEMTGFLLLYHLAERAVPLVHPSFLRDEELGRDSVLVLTRAGTREVLETLGTVTVLAQSERPRSDANDVFTLFRLVFREGLERLPVGELRVTPLEAMGRRPRPRLGP